MALFLLRTPNSMTLEPLWQEVGADITAQWVAANAGRRPWAWWRFNASEPRRCVHGAELLAPVRQPGDWDWVWKKDFGVPAFQQCRPLGYIGLPAVESQAACLDRLGLLSADERMALDDDAFEPVEVDPFVISAEYLARYRLTSGVRLDDGGIADGRR
jgi:hypothetical protein